MNTYSHLTLLIDSIPLKYDLDGEVVKVKLVKLKSTVNHKRSSVWTTNSRRSWL